jgi:hypothetical protein
MDPAFLTIAEINRFYDQRELSPVEVARSLLDRIAAHDGKLHSFIRVTPEVALAEARAAERELTTGRRRGTASLTRSRTSSRPPVFRPPAIRNSAATTSRPPTRIS